jgi:nucleotide-binding universal stress UspA family protein
MRVIVGVDGSPNSFAAVAFIGRILAPERDQLVLLFAAPTLSLQEELDPLIEQRARSVLSSTVLEAALERLPAAWRQRAEQKEVADAPGKALLDAVKERDAELVVVGFRGTSSLWEEFLLGSVSRTVVQSANTPVLVVKQRRADADAPTSGTEQMPQPFRALAAYDGSPAAERIAKLLQQFSWPELAEGWVITVVRPWFPFDVPEWVKNQPRDPDVAAMAAAWEQEHQQNLQAARRELEQFRDQLPPLFARQDAIVVEGRPAEQIVTQLRSQGIDLAIVGSHGRGRLQRLLLGSTAEQVLASAPCSVLIAR